jgi:N-acetylneuraminic acid mutarotase
MTRNGLLISILSLLWGCAGAAPAPSHVTSTSTPAATAPERIVVGGSFLAAMPQGLTSFGGAVLNGDFYMVGGYGGEPHRYTAEGQSRDIWKLSLAAPSIWSKVGTLPYGLQGLAVVAHQGELCRFGGNRVEASMRSIADAACWNTKTGAWRALPDLPSGRSSLDAAVIGSTVYLAGGWQVGSSEQSGEWAADILRMDLAARAPKWESIEAPIRTRAASVVAVGTKLYLMGGLGANKEPSRTVSIFDPATGTWSRGPDLPSDGFGVAAIANEDTLVITTRDGAVSELRDGAWRALGTLTFPRMFHRLAWAGPSQLAAIGGITGMQTHGRTRLVEVLSLEKTGDVARVEIAFPGQAKNRQAIFVHEDFLYVFGGNTSLEQHDFAPGNFVDEGHRLHLPSLTWTRVNAYPQKRQSMQVAWVGSELLALGGFGHNGTAAVSFNEGYSFDPRTETWKPAQNLPAGRTQFGLATHEGQVYVFGGLNYDPARSGDAAFDHVTTNLVAKAPQGFGDLGAPLPGPRRAFGGVTLGDEYFIVGGMRESFKLVDDCLRYSFASKQYRPMPCPQKTRLSARLVALDGKVYAVSGNTRGSGGALEADRSIEVFDPKTSRWSLLTGDVGFDTHHANVATYRGRIVMASSQNDSGTMTLAFIGAAR